MLLSLLCVLTALADTVTVQAADTVVTPAVITVDDAIRIALDENETVRIAEMEVERTGYAKKGTYASLFPQVDASGSFQHTIKKQVMYLDVPGMESGMEMGRYNTFSGNISASMPIVNFSLWENLKITGQDVELAVEKARGSRLDMVSQVKQAYFSVLLAKEAAKVYKEVYTNAEMNFKRTEMRHNAQKASDLELARSATSLANAIPNLYDSENAVFIALWQLKAVMGIDLDAAIDVDGSLLDYADELGILFAEEDLSLDGNSSMRQLAIQAEQLAAAVRIQQKACLPSLAATFAFSYSAMANDFEFSNYKWTPYSYVGLSLNIPIFAGGKRATNTKAAKVQSAELDLNRAKAERQLKIAIRQYLNTMETAIKTYDASDKALDAARKAYNITEESYAVGKSTITDLNDAQLALVQAQLSATQAVFNYLSAKASLEQTIGTDYTTTEE